MFPEQPGITFAKNRYVNEYGVYGSVPMDVLHTLPNGAMKMLKDVGLELIGSNNARVANLNERLTLMPHVRDPERRRLIFECSTAVFQDGASGLPMTTWHLYNKFRSSLEPIYS